ncbi:asparagine synthase (glutamine-hydrolysing) [Haloactinopolyspora alba]|uniref:asparagine synthase (glutamine-hydrolyzing) n=1 Tax=Haloactinopolyspora alba TaxID=648780 RepID=A0A2P8E5I8_9ACTN|nr:asparagine synthetase B family protein [Haloactinopolyspora alba]PSL04735.1 asparagine synthase (glutamine-hydrolysing) [Haloactinopolyspora alba]
MAHEVVSTSNATAALVSTEPVGAGEGVVSGTGDNLMAAVALTKSGLSKAVSDTVPSAAVGAEAGHVVVAAEPDGTITVRNDGAGVVPVFWFAGAHDLCVSTHLASLVSLGAPADPDMQGMVEYLAMLHPLGQRTTLAKASILPAGGELTWRPGGVGEVRSQPVFAPSGETMSDVAAVDTFRDTWNVVMRDIIDRREGGRLALSLSGGLDSRAIACALAALGSGASTFTYGTRGQREVEIATAIAERLGMPHTTMPLTGDRILPEMSAGAERLDGAHAPSELYDSWFHDAIHQFADVVVNGHAGGPLWGDEKAHGLRSLDDVAAHVHGRYAGAVTQAETYLADRAGGDIDAILRASIRASLEPWDFSRRSDMITYWQVTNRQTRWGNMVVSAMRRRGIRVETPFMDGRFLSYAARLGPSQRRNGRLYLRIHRTVFPQTADVPRSDDGNPPDRLSHLYWSGDTSFLAQWLAMTAEHPVSGVRRGARRAAMQGASLLRTRLNVPGPADRLATRASAFPADLLVRTRPTYASRLASWVESNAGAHPMFDDEQLFAAVAALRSGTFTGSASALARVATANTWLADYARRGAARRELLH